MPILDELQQSRRRSYAGAGRRQSGRASFSYEAKRRMSMGYEHILLKEEERPQGEESQRAPSLLPGLDDFRRDELFRSRSKPATNVEKKRKSHFTGQFASEMHRIMTDFTESRTFAIFILSVILVNTGILIAQTWQIVAIRGGWYFSVLDSIFLGIYIMEMVFKIYVYRTVFFNEGWNILDLSIVVVNLVDFGLPLIIQNVKGFNGAAIFRLLRIFRAVRAIRALRVLRTIRFLANLQVIMVTLMQSIRSIGAIVTLISLFMYMFAVIGRGLYSKEDPEHFGSIFSALFTLFQLLTLDDWFEIQKTVASKGRGDIIIYLFLYIVAEYFVFLNLFVAVLVDNFQLTLDAQNEANKKKSLQDVEVDDDLEDYFLTPDDDDEEDSNDSVSDIEERKNINKYFSEAHGSDLHGLNHYYQLISSLEYNSHVLGNQQRLLNVLVDMAADMGDDES